MEISLDIGIQTIKAQLKTAPTVAGVYRMIDEQGDVLYVGKAKNLKARITSYTQARQLSSRIIKMVAKTRSMVLVTTRTEAEALLLEASLIKRLKPPYNVLLKDDKSFPYIFLRDDHSWPQITKHRGARKKDGLYFGPFASAGAVNHTLNTLQKVFQLRSCSDATLESRTRPCLLYQIKRCSGPCVDRVTAVDYKAMVKETRAFLEGRTSDIQKRFADQMQAASAAMDYEQAAIFRDRLKALTQIQSHQAMIRAIARDADVIGAAERGGQVGIQMFFFRAGQNWGHRAFFPRHSSDDKIEDVLSAFMAQFYDNKPVPREIIMSHTPSDARLLEEGFGDHMGHKIKIYTPKRGPKADTVGEAVRNAIEALERRLAENASQMRLMEGLAESFELDGPPERIEIYDNSHIQGGAPIGAMVVAGKEGFQKNQYRKFNIKDEDTAPGDDFAMMREVMRRRFKRLVKEDEDRSKGRWPDLLLIDGGKGQLSAVWQILDDLGIEDLAVIGVSKGPDRDAGREQFHRRGQTPFMLRQNDPVLFYVQRLRDEAHRFAIGSHRQKRSANMVKSPLDGVPGIGARRKKALLLHFGSAKAVTGADVRDLASVDGISLTLAQQIYDYFRD